MAERIPQPQVTPPEPETAGRKPEENIEAKRPPESPEMIFENLRETQESLLQSKSQKAAEIAGLYLQGKLTSSEARDGVEKIPDREELVVNQKGGAGTRRGGGTQPLPFFLSRELLKVRGVGRGLEEGMLKPPRAKARGGFLASFCDVNV